MPMPRRAALPAAPRQQVLRSTDAPAYAPGSGTQHFFVLLLQRDTFLGSDGLRTAELVRTAQARGMRVLLLHRVEACDFAWILETTPPDLIGAGLYQKIAIDYMARPSHAAVSAAYLANELGAREIKIRHEMRRRHFAPWTRFPTQSLSMWQ